MKHIVIQHDLTAFDLSKKARPLSGGTAASKMNYTLSLTYELFPVFAR